MRHSFDIIRRPSVTAHDAPSVQSLPPPLRRQTTLARRESDASTSSDVDLVVMDDEVQNPRRGDEGHAIFSVPATPQLLPMDAADQTHDTRNGPKRHKGGDQVEVIEARSKLPPFGLYYTSGHTLSPGGDDEASEEAVVLDLDDMALEFTPHTAPASTGTVNVASLLPSLIGIGLDIMGTQAAIATGKHCYHLHFALRNEDRVVKRLLASAMDQHHPLMEQVRDNGTVLLRGQRSESQYNLVKGLFAGPVAGVGMALIGASILLGPAMLGRFDHAMAEAAVDIIPVVGAALIALYGVAMSMHDGAHVARYTRHRRYGAEIDEKNKVVDVEDDVHAMLQARLKRQQSHAAASLVGYDIMAAGVLTVQFVGAAGLAPLGVSLFTQLGTSYYGSKHVGYMSQFTPEQKMKLGSVREIMNYVWQHDAEYSVYNAEKNTKRLLFPLGEETPVPFNYIVRGVAAIKRRRTQEHLAYTSARASLYRMFIGQAEVKKAFYGHQKKLLQYQLAKDPDGTAADEAKRSAFWTKHLHYEDKTRAVNREIGWLQANMNRDVEPWEGVFDVAHFLSRRHIFDDWAVEALSNKPLRTMLVDLGVAERIKSAERFGETKVRVDANKLVWALIPEGDMDEANRVSVAARVYEAAQKVVFTVAKTRAQHATRELLDMLAGRAQLSVEENEAEAKARAQREVDGASIASANERRILQGDTDAMTV